MAAAAMNTILPAELFWLSPAQQSLRQARATGRFPHAILIHAAIGAGGEELATFAAQTALCREPQAPCLRCADCQHAAARAHADLHWVQPLEESVQIRVEQIRSLNQALSLTAHGGGAAVAVLSPADGMNDAAGNALLKSLEEPRAGTTVILLASAPALLRATIRSRCLRLNVVTPGRAETLAWLQAQRGPGPWEEVLDVVADAPLAAVQADAPALAAFGRGTYAELDAVLAGRRHPGELGSEWAREERLTERLRCTVRWVTRGIDAQLRQMHDGVANPGTRHLSERSAMPKIARLLRVASELQTVWQQLGTTVNKALAIESLMWQVAALRGV
jgi:DNA polymerase III subunit delta'